MANNSKNTQKTNKQENLKQANENLENLEQTNENQEQAEETQEKSKSNADSLAVEAKGFSESEEFKVGKANPVENTDDTQVIIRF